jgi:DNA-binding MarR family transcriptional regulator
MEINELIERYAGERSKEVRGIFASIFILQNRLQTLFDNVNPELTLKQFMLIAMIKQAGEKTTFTHLGKLLGSSRQNVKKLATSLEEKGFLTIELEAENKRNTSLVLTEKAAIYTRDIAALHEENLGELFQDYSAEEIHLFYQLMMKLYAGVAEAEQKMN